MRVGRRKAADSIYEDGVQIHLFLDKYRRPLYKEKHVASKTWWTPEETGAQDMVWMRSVLAMFLCFSFLMKITWSNSLKSSSSHPIFIRDSFFVQLTALKSNWALIRKEALDITKRENFYTTVMEKFVMTGGVKEFPLFFRSVCFFFFFLCLFYHEKKKTRVIYA